MILLCCCSVTAGFEVGEGGGGGGGGGGGARNGLEQCRNALRWLQSCADAGVVTQQIAEEIPSAVLDALRRPEFSASLPVAWRGCDHSHSFTYHSHTTHIPLTYHTCTP